MARAFSESRSDAYVSPVIDFVALATLTLLVVASTTVLLL